MCRVLLFDNDQEDGEGELLFLNEWENTEHDVGTDVTTKKKKKKDRSTNRGSGGRKTKGKETRLRSDWLYFEMETTENSEPNVSCVLMFSCGRFRSWARRGPVSPVWSLRRH